MRNKSILTEAKQIERAVTLIKLDDDDALAASELLEKLLSQLKPDDRLVIQLLDLDQKTVAEISVLTGWNQTVVKVRAFRARRKLQKLLKELEKRERS